MSQTIEEAGQAVVMDESEKEESYLQVQQLIKSMSCIVQYELMLYIYRVIIKRLKALGDYKDSEDLLKEYTKKIAKLKKTGKEEIYQNMIKKKNAVSQAEDLQWVLKEADRIPGYKDTEEVRLWCEAEMEVMNKKEQKFAVIRLIIIIAVLFVIALGIKVMFASFYK